MLKLEVQVYSFKSLCHQLLRPRSPIQITWSILVTATVFSWTIRTASWQFSLFPLLPPLVSHITGRWILSKDKSHHVTLLLKTLLLASHHTYIKAQNLYHGQMWSGPVISANPISYHIPSHSPSSSQAGLLCYFLCILSMFLLGLLSWLFSQPRMLFFKTVLFFA